MLADLLNTNQIKNAAGTELEFTRLSTNGRATEYGLITESPALPKRIKIQHLETGSGIRRVRRSNLRGDFTVLSSVDSITPVVCTASLVVVIPVGALTANTEAANVLAAVGSLTFTLASSTFLYDGTGNGAAALLAGGL
jgi:hypothetical protein